MIDQKENKSDQLKKKQQKAHLLEDLKIYFWDYRLVFYHKKTPFSY